ncbi:hypothetical protein J3R82DRAFT_12009 [Butyriboletus roseoflavus]|nr:hypothetical protein J3R82DRAFT_12009 [Butyriboletus roseoflavus]
MNELKELVSSVNFNEPYNITSTSSRLLRPRPRLSFTPRATSSRPPSLWDKFPTCSTSSLLSRLSARFAAFKSEEALEWQTYYEGEKTHGREEDVRLLAANEVRTLRRFLDKRGAQRWEYIVLLRILIQLYIHYLWTAPESCLLAKRLNDFFPGSIQGVDEPSESLFHIDLSEDEREYLRRLKVECQEWMKLVVDWETKREETCQDEGLAQEDTDEVLAEDFRARFPQPSTPSETARSVEIYMDKVERMVQKLEQWFPVCRLESTHTTTPPRLSSLLSPQPSTCSAGFVE